MIKKEYSRHLIFDTLIRLYQGPVLQHIKLVLKADEMDDAYEEIRNWLTAANLPFELGVSKIDKMNDGDRAKTWVRLEGIAKEWYDVKNWDITKYKAFTIQKDGITFHLDVEQIIEGIGFKYAADMVDCVVCDDPIRVVQMFDDGGMIIHDGGTLTASFGYGSGFDSMCTHEFVTPEESKSPAHAKLHNLPECDRIIGYICDACFERKLDYWKGFVTERPKRPKQKRIV